MRRILVFFILTLATVAVSPRAVAQHLPIYIPPQQHTSQVSRGLNPQKSITHYIHRTWTMEQGLPQNSAQALCQTRDGYMWIGTEEGLVRFDGVQFTIFDVGNTPGLKANTIQALCEDRTGRLWIGTNGGGISVYHKGVFAAFTSREGLSHDFVSSIVEDHTAKQGTVLWVGTQGGGVNRLEVDTKPYKCTTFTSANGLTHNIVFSLIQSRSGALWIGTNGGGVNRYEQGKFSALTTADGLSRNQVRSLCEDRNGTIWIGTFGGGLNRYAGGKITTYTTQNGLLHDIVWSLCEDRMGAIWIGTFGGGVNRLYNGVLSAFTADNGLSGNLVRAICEDKEGTLWVGTVGGLNHFVDGQFTTYTTKDGLTHDVVRAVQPKRNGGAVWIGTFGGGVNAIFESNAPILAPLRKGAANAVSGGFTVMPAVPKSPVPPKRNAPRGRMRQRQDVSFQTASKILRTITTQNGLPTDIIYALLEDKSTGKDSGAVWIGTNGGGLCRFKQGKLTTFTTKNGLTNDVVFTLLQDTKGVLWIGTVGGGLNRYENGVFTALSTRNGFPSDNIRVLLEDRTGALWIGTVGGGLIRYFKGAWTTFTTNNGLSNNTIRALYEDETGALWIGTVGGGLNRFHNGAFTAFTTKEGLFNDVIHSIVDDGCGYLWMSCNKGIFRVLKQDLNSYAEGRIMQRSVKTITCDVFGTQDGMINAECNSGSPAGAKDHAGNLWFATMTGVVTVNPRSMKTGSEADRPTVIIEAVQADSVRLDVSLPQTLPADKEKIEFHYTATNLTSPERIRFRYILEGYDKQWVDAGRRRTAYYTNLPRGRSYRFRVQTSNGDGSWSGGGASVELTLEAVFWETWWFYALCGVLLIFLIVALFRIRLAGLQRRAARLQMLVREQTLELQQSNEEVHRHLEALDKQAREIEQANGVLREKNTLLQTLHQEKDEFLGIAAHDLRNPLTSIQLAAELIRKARSLPNSETLVQEQLSKIALLTERMTGIISNFLGMNALESGSMQFERKEQLLVPILTEVVEEYQLKADLKSIKILTELPSNDRGLSVYTDKQVLEEILENLISNAIKFSPFGKNVYVRVAECSPPEQFVRIEIQDEGQGISDAEKEHLFKKFTRLSTRPTGGEDSTGLGLSIVKKMVEAMQGRVWCESETSDGRPNGRPTGATFIVELPQTALSQNTLSQNTLSQSE